MNDRGVGMIAVWIFIMVAGGMILLVFFMIASSQVDLGKEKLTDQALQQVSSILATQQSSSDTYVTVPIPSEPIRVVCEPIPDSTDPETVLSQLEIGGRAEPLQYDLVVGRDLEADDLILFSKSLSLPFDIGNVLFLSSAHEVLVLDDGGVDADAAESATAEFAALLPPSVHVRVNAPVQAQDFQQTRVVLIAPGSYASLGAGDFSSVGAAHQAQLMAVEPIGGDWRTRGRLHFYIRTPSSLEYQSSIEYFSQEMLLALIWQGDYESARCLEYKLRARLAQQARLQAKRYDLLSVNDPSCSTYTRFQLDGLADAAEAGDDLSDPIRFVRLKNEEALRGSAGCATIY